MDIVGQSPEQPRMFSGFRLSTARYHRRDRARGNRLRTKEYVSTDVE